MRSILIATAIAAVLAVGPLGAPAAAQTDTELLRDRLSQMCTPQSRDEIAAAAREAIETHVSRAEAAIAPPMPIEELSCLTDLMSADLSTLSNGILSITGLFAELANGLANISVSTVTGAVAAKVCDVARAKWQEVTQPLRMQVSQLRSKLTPDYIDRFGILNLSRGQLPNLPGLQGGGTPFVAPSAVRSGAATLAPGISTTPAARLVTPLQGAGGLAPAPVAGGGASPIDPALQQIWDALNKGTRQ